MICRALVLSVLISLIDFASSDDFLRSYEVKTNKGVIIGERKLSYRGRNYASFEGIPYAKPPVGNLRFRDPVISDLPDGEFHANKTYVCMQYMAMDHIRLMHGTEDCLYLNIYIPKEKITGNENLDVIIYIHGGGFMIGSAKSDAGANYLMDKDLILITMNYRLGILGFMTTEDSVVPGNMGLKDQSTALRWIKNNVHYFGGNPNSITLIGFSAGGCSTHYHYLSPMSKGLFNRGLSQSGNGLQSWSIRRNSLEYTKRMAKELKCDTSSSTVMVKCLKTVNAHDLLKSTDVIIPLDKMVPLLIFGPTIEKGSPNPFLAEHPYKLLKEGRLVNDVPWINSNVRDEGIYPVFFIFILRKIKEINLYWYDLTPHFLDLKDTVDESNMNTTLDKIKRKYISTDIVTNTRKSLYELVKMCTDRLFLRGSEKALRLQAKVSKSFVYSYKFSYVEEQTPLLPFVKRGVAHGDDVRLMFNGLISPAKLGAKDEAMMEIMTEFIANYAANKSLEMDGVPWKPVDPSSEYIDYMEIKGPGKIKMNKIIEMCDNQFWDSLPIKENEKEI